MIAAPAASHRGTTILVMKKTLLFPASLLVFSLSAHAQSAAPAHGEPGHVHAEGDATNHDHAHDHGTGDGHVHADEDGHHHHAAGPNSGVIEHIGDNLVEAVLKESRLQLRLFQHDMTALDSTGWTARGTAGERGASPQRLSFSLADGVFTSAEEVPAADHRPIRLVLQDADGNTHRLQIHQHGTELASAGHEEHGEATAGEKSPASDPGHGQPGHSHEDGENHADHQH